MISIIIPTFNEEDYCYRLFDQLKSLDVSTEVIVVDGGSSDKTTEIVDSYGFQLLKSEKGRSNQMSFGANKSQGEFLLFLHADVVLSKRALKQMELLLKERVELASFRIQFDYKHWFLKFNAFFSRVSHPYFHFGDQALWISKSLYTEINGFRLDHLILEDQDIYSRASKRVKGKKVNATVVISARKYLEKGVYMLQLFYCYLWLKYKLKYSQESLYKEYLRFMES